MIEIWELENDLVAGGPFVPFVHMSGLHAADMHKIGLSQESGLEKCVGDNASNEAKFRELRPYSVRKACIGSRREARQAGKMQANKALKRRVRITAPITAGSVGLVP